MKYIFLLLLALSVQAEEWPPTTVKSSSDTTAIPTYNFQFPNFTGTHTGGQFSLGINSVAGGGTGLGTYTTGSVLFFDGTYINQNNTKLFWDNTNFRLGVGTNAPIQAIDVGATGEIRVGTIVGASTVPTVAYGTGAGTGATTAALIGTEISGYIQFTTGTTPAVGTIFTLTAPIACPNYWFTVIYPSNAAAAAVAGRIYDAGDSATTNAFGIVTTALTAATAYAFKWVGNCY